MGKIFMRQQFATVPTELLNNPAISLKAKGIFAFIQSKPDGWTFSIDRMQSQLREGREAIRAALRELESYGYLRRVQFRENGEFSENNYYLYHEPYSEFIDDDDDVKTDVGKSDIGDTVVGKPDVGKPDDISNIDYSNRDSSKIDISKGEREKNFLQKKLKNSELSSFEDNPPPIAPPPLPNPWQKKTAREITDAIFSIRNPDLLPPSMVKMGLIHREEDCKISFEDFKTWKKAVTLIKSKFDDLLGFGKMFMPQDIPALIESGFTEDKWETIFIEIAGCGILPHANLYHRIIQFITTHKNGKSKQQQQHNSHNTKMQAFLNHNPFARGVV